MALVTNKIFFGNVFQGCPVLLKKIKELKELKLVVFGHIHATHGIMKQDDVTFVNAAICVGDGYQVKWDPIVVNL